MKTLIVRFCVFLFISNLLFPVVAQKKATVEMIVTLPQAIEMARQQSIESFRIKNMYLSRYWEFRSYKADRLPGLNLKASPFTYNRSYTFDLSNREYRPDQSLTSYAELGISQNITLTGGKISLNSDLERYENFENGDLFYVATPLNVRLNQPLNGYNEYRWNARIEPLKFEKARRELVHSVEDLAVRTSENFFRLASAEINVKIAETNFSNADTLFRIAKGRFEIGTVTQDELLDLELSLLNARIEVTKSNLTLQQARASLNSFLLLDENILVKCIIPDKIPGHEVEMDRALDLALSNNSQILSFEQLMLEANKKVAVTKAGSKLNAGINAIFGVNNRNSDLESVYKPKFAERQGIGVSLNVPIIDWGLRNGMIQMAKAERDVTEAVVRQGRIDFEQNVFQQVVEFNLQDDQVLIAAKADTIAQLGYDVTKQRFLIDKVDVIKLNSARNSLDAAKRNYVDALRRYWNYYYSIRRLTLFDFENNTSLLDQIDTLLQK
jgi:outer membrane protein TolC